MFPQLSTMKILHTFREIERIVQKLLYIFHLNFFKVNILLLIKYFTIYYDIYVSMQLSVYLSTYFWCFTVDPFESCRYCGTLFQILSVGIKNKNTLL